MIEAATPADGAVLAAADAEYLSRAEEDFYTFARGLVIPVQGGEPRMFDDCMADFQRRCFRELSASLRCLREGWEPPRQRFWLERTKGTAKDSDIAVCLAWLLAFPRRPLYIQVGAADKDQAAIVRRRMEDLIYWNPWLVGMFDLRQYHACSTPLGVVKLDILAADVHGSHGETPDLLVVNELSHVQRWEFIENLLDNADKVVRGVVVIATNAGCKGTRTWKMRESALAKPDRWTVRIWDRPAPWISAEFLEDAKQRNQQSRYLRLWWGRWSSGKGDALSEDDIDRCLGAHPGPAEGPEDGWLYVHGLDLGISHDHAGFVTVGVHVGQQRLRLASFRRWRPDPRTGKVDLIAVRETVFAECRRWRSWEVDCDPTEAQLMAQELRRQGVIVREVPFTPSNLTAMASALVQAISGKQIGEGEGFSLASTLEAYDDEEGWLRRDLGKLSVVERVAGKGFGYKLEAVSDEDGHADVAVALAICLPRAIAVLAGRGGLRPDEELVSAGEDVQDEDMPAELRELYEQPDDAVPEGAVRVPCGRPSADVDGGW